jgi:two-component system chemotaxis response regulator CheY
VRILIAEDELTSRKIIQILLSPLGECVDVGDGLEAILAYNDAYATGSPFDLVFLDLMMPKVDGRTALKNIRKLENETGISLKDRAKVIITTSLADSYNIEKAIQLECDGYLLKPVVKEKLMDQLRKLGIPMKSEGE